MSKIMARECQNVEFKTSWHDKYLEWICGFANAQVTFQRNNMVKTSENAVLKSVVKTVEKVWGNYGNHQAREDYDNPKGT